MSAQTFNDESTDTKIAVAHRFTVTIDGFRLGGWSKIDGLHFTVFKTEVKEGGNNTHTRALLGVVQWTPITLTRVVVDDDWYETLDWLSNAIQPDPGRLPMGRELNIEINNAWGQPVRTLSFQHARPIEWKVTPLDTSKSAAALETLTFFHHGLFPNGMLEAG